MTSPCTLPDGDEDEVESLQVAPLLPCLVHDGTAEHVRHGDSDGHPDWQVELFIDGIVLCITWLAGLDEAAWV